MTVVSDDPGAWTAGGKCRKGHRLFWHGLNGQKATEARAFFFRAARNLFSHTAEVSGYSPLPFTMFEARLIQGVLLKKIIDSIKDLVEHANWVCSRWVSGGFCFCAHARLFPPAAWATQAGGCRAWTMQASMLAPSLSFAHAPWYSLFILFCS